MSLKDVVLHAGETRLRVDCVELDWQPLALLRRREVQLDTLWLAGVQVELAPATDAPEQEGEPWAGLSLPVAVFVDDLRVDGVSLRRAVPAAQVVSMAAPSPNAGDVRVDTQSLLNSLNARFSLEPSGLHVQHLVLDGLGGSWGSNLRLHGDWGMQPKDALTVSLAWTMPLRLADGGWLDLAGEGRIDGTLEALSLHHTLTQPFAARLEADVQPMDEGLPWSAALHVKPLSLAEQPALARFLPPELASRLGTLALELDAQGTQSVAMLERLELNQDSARLRMSGQVGWAEGLHWNVAAQAEGVRPHVFVPEGAGDWTGELALEAQSAGSLQDGKPVGSFKVERLHGQLRGYPLEASLSAEIKSWASGLPQLALEALRLRSGASTLEARGAIGERLELTGTLDSANLAEFVPQASGRAQANIGLSGTIQQPSVKAEVQGRNLGWQALTLAALDMKAEGGLQLDAPMNLELEAKGLRQDAKPLLESVDVALSGVARAHDLRLNVLALSAAGGAKSPPLRLNLQAQGAWDGALERLRIQSMMLDNTPTGSWVSTQPVELVAGADQFSLPAWCGVLTTPPGNAQACVQGEWRAGKQGASARLSVSDFNLSGLDTLLRGKPVQLRGVLEGFVAVDAPQGEPMRIVAAVDGQDVVARVQTGLPNQALRGVPEWREIALDATHVEAELGGGAGRLAVNVGINDANRIEMRLNLPGLGLDGGVPPNQPMQGFVDLRFEDNALLAGFLPMLKEPQGRLAGRLLIAGTLDEPQVSGGVQVVDGRMVLPDLGVRVTEGRLLLRAYAANYLTLEGSAMLGAGKATLDGRIDLADFPQWQARLHVGGSNLTVMRLPNASVQASPDLTLHLSPSVRQITGRVEVTQALFDVGGFGAGAVRRSSDVRVLGEAPPEPAGTIEADVLLVLGEQVRIEGLGFKGRVQGQVRVLDKPGQAAPLAQGELLVLDGRYRAYGQDLLIDQGRLLFANSPLTNPGLDIRAVRRVTQDDVVVGLHISGRATAPKITLFSQPSLPQSEMLSYLVSGRSSKTGSGASTQTMLQIAQAAGLMAATDLAEGSVARDLGLDELGFETALGSNDLSLAIGKYLTPRIYLRYLQGLGNGVQDLVMTFDWTRAIQLRGQVGTQSSGFDIFYRFER
jgi:translocation and assembly module TamB